MRWLLVSSDSLAQWGFCIVRIGIGLLFVIHGYPKLIGGTSSWVWLGSQMQRVGITFFPVMWGILAALAELVGGLCLLCGFGTRIAAFLMANVMVIALVCHLAKGDPYSSYSHPLALLIIFFGCVVAGGGRYSLDAFMQKK